MITKRLKSIFGLSIPLFILHGIEEYQTGFYKIDPLDQLIFKPFLEMDGHQVMFITFQVMFLLLLVVSLLLVLNERWRLRMMFILGIVYVIEVHHIWNAVAAWSYYPGLYTAIFFPVLAFFFWRELMRVYRLPQSNSAHS